MIKNRLFMIPVALLCITATYTQDATSANPAEQTAAENPGTPVNPPRPVNAKWTNGQYYKGKVIAEREGQGLVKWDDGSEPIWVNNGDMTEIKKAPANAKKVYAEYHNGLYYKALVIESDAKETLIDWEDGSGTAKVANDKVHPRKGHKLKADWIGDRELSPAEQRAKAKADAQSKADNAAKYTVSCGKLRSRLDCMRSFDPCAWNNNRCDYRGY